MFDTLCFAWNQIRERGAASVVDEGLWPVVGDNRREMSLAVAVEATPRPNRPVCVFRGGVVMSKVLVSRLVGLGDPGGEPIK